MSDRCCSRRSGPSQTHGLEETDPGPRTARRGPRSSVNNAPIAVNYHLFKPCNDRCRFCFATFRDVQGMRPTTEARRLIQMLHEAGSEKLNVVGGEPTLHPDIGELVELASTLGFTTSMVTNGARLATLLATHHRFLDWIGRSVDAGREDTQAALGRGRAIIVPGRWSMPGRHARWVFASS